MSIYLVELEAYDAALPGVRTLRYSSGAGYTAGFTTAASSSGTVVEPTLNPLVTFTRSSTATRTNSAGIMETVGANVPRFDYDSETLQPLGLLIEEGRTNLYRSTGNLLPTGGSWGASVPGGQIVTPTAELAPNGVEYFARIERVSGDWRQSTATFTAGGTYTGSVFAKRGNQPLAGFELHFTGGTTVQKSISYNFDTGALAVTSTGATGAVVKLRNGIVRLTLTVTDDGDGTTGYMLISTGFTAGAAGSSALYWGAQFEAGSVPTSYIPSAPVFSSRSTAATYYDSTGTMQTAASGVARFGYFYTGSEWVMPGLMVEGASTNLLGWSATQSPWGVSSNLSRTFFAGLAPDGSYTATRYKSLTTPGISPALNPYPTTTAGTTYSFSVHIKRTAGSWSWVRLRLDPAGGTWVGSAYVNIDTGATGSVTAADGTEVTTFRAAPPVDLGNGWYRIGFTYLMPTATGASIIVYPTAGDGNSVTVVGDEWLFWGAQLEATSAPSSYIPTPATFTGRTSSGTYYNSAGVLTTAGSGVARNTYVYAGGQWILGGLLLEPAATNLLLQSNSFSTSPWGAGASGDVAVAVGSIAAPDGSFAATLGDTNTAGPNGRLQSIGITSSTNTYTGSVYLRAGTSSVASVRLFLSGATTAAAELVVDLASGAAVWRGGNVGTGFQVIPSGVGWYRVAVTVTDNGTGNNALSLEIRPAFALAYPATSFDNAATGTVHVFGAMLEAGSSMTSYYPSGASAGVRSADTSTSPSVSRATDTVTNPTATRAAESPYVGTLTPWHNASEGTFIVEWTPHKVAGANNFVPAALLAAATPTENRVALVLSAAFDSAYSRVYVSNVGYEPPGRAISAAGIVLRQAIAYKVGDTAATVNGTAVTTSAPPALPTVDRLTIGQQAGAFSVNGHIRRVAFVSSRLSDTALVAASVAGSALTGTALDLDFLTYAAPTVSIANGTYTLVVGGDVSTETRTVTVTGGSHTIEPSAGNARVTSYAFYTEASGTPESTYFDGRVQEPGNWTRSIYAPGTTAGESMVGAGEIVLANPDGALDALLDYGVGGRAVRVWTVPDEATPFSSAARWATGTAEQVEVSWQTATLRLRDRLELLRKPLQTTLYAGTTTAGGMNEAEGQAEDLKGQVKPLLYGEAYNIPAVLANAFDLIYQVSDGAVQSIDAVYDAGVPLLFSADYASISALRGASIQGGYYATAKALGLFRIGSSPFGTVTCDATEGATAGDRTAAQIAKRMLTRMGFTASDYDSASIAALDTDNSSNVGVWLSEPTEALEAITGVLGTVGGWLLPTRMGAFEMGRMEAPAGTPVAVWTEAEILDRGSGIERLASNDVGAGVPIWKVTVRYGRIYAVQTGEALAGCVATARRAELASEWRSVTATDAGVKTLHLNAGELTVDTLYADEADAQDEANRLLALYSTRRDRLMVPIDTDLAAAVDLGRTVQVKIQRWGYNSGRLMTVIGLTERAGAGVTDVEVWG